MDKYTVDLDQVLNDFEYSELTDQQSKNASEKLQNPTSFQTAPVTKHSINNVFHSLNEYLNSEISTNSDKFEVGGENLGNTGKIDNNFVDNVQQTFGEAKDNSNSAKEGTYNGKNELDACESLGQNERLLKLKNEPKISDISEKSQDPLKQGKDIKILEKTEVEETKVTQDLVPNLLELSDEITDKENLIQPTDFLNNTNETVDKTENRHFSLLDTENVEAVLIPGLNTESNTDENVNIDKQCDKIIDNKADHKSNNEQTISGEKENFFNASECNLNENVHSVENNEEMTENIEEKDVESKDVENFVIEPSKSPYALSEGNLEAKQSSESTKVTDNSPGDSDETKCDTNAVKLDIEKDLPKDSHDIHVKLSGISEEMLSSTEKENTEIQNADNVAEDDVENEIKLESSSQKVVGFSADLEIDESELNKMLEDLEIEEECDLNDDPVIQVGERKTEDISQKCDVIEDDIKEDDLKVKKMNNSEGESLIETSESHISNAETLLTKEITSQKENQETSETNIEQSSTQVIECLEMEKPSKNKKKSSNKTEKPENIKKDITETADSPQEAAVEQQEVVQNIEKEPVKVLQKQHSQDSLSRPQDLPLNNELKENTVTRKIDLIGSPGSTPYNNVYINKTIEPKATHDTDSDYTSSASPTFSDCSTESTSTASTVSVEDLPKNSEVPVKNHRHKKKESGKKGNPVREGGTGERNVQEHPDANSVPTQDTEGAEGLPNDTTLNSEQNRLQSGGEGVQERTAETFLDKSWLGKEAPLWIPDADAAACLHCDMKFTVLKRRHHCRACGLVLCSKCCNLKFRLEYLDAEARVCNKCYRILSRDSSDALETGQNTSEAGDSPFRPNPNNPLEYCSTVSPLQQIGAPGAPPPSVMVPVGVLKRKGSNKKSNKSVMFCDGIAPGSDLTNLDQDFNYNPETNVLKSPQKVPDEVKKKEEPPPVVPTVKSSRNQPKPDPHTGCFIPKSETSLPPTVCVNKTDILYSDCSNSPGVVEMLKNEALTFAINQNLFVNVKVINMSCCINKLAWCFSTNGLMNVGSDEIVYLVEYIDEESFVPKDVFFHIYNVFLDAAKGTSIKELGLSLHNTSNFLDSKNHAGFVYIRPTFQCLENVLKPKEPYLIGILIHRWETPWAKLFPLRLILRLGAEYRYYPSPLISTRHRDSVFVEIGNTIINLLADFRNFTYTLPEIRGLIIHMEDKKTTITIPKNRYDQVMKSINNSSEHILAFAGNFSSEADSHLVCIQDTQGHENVYTTHAINIHNKPRKITGASFIVFNGSLKSSSGLTAKSNIVEDGLMIQVPSEHMDKIRDNLRNMKNHMIACGCINATSDETVNIVWGENDLDFNAGVFSPVDLTDMKGIPSIRVHNGKDHFCNNGTRLIRWTEVFIMQNGEENTKNQDPVDISKVSESIAKACCTALVKYLDLLVSNSCQKIGIRANLHVENVSYSAGSNGFKLPPIYMRSLDNELIPVLHKITSNNLGDNAVVLELIFRILNA